MAKGIQTYLILLHVSTIFHATLALLAIPTEDLLGPGNCPDGSVCTDISTCPMEYYKLTKTYVAFYCGPHESIDSKICCVEYDLEGRASLNDVIDQNEVEVRDVDSRFADLQSGEADDDDGEVDILSLPFATNQLEDGTSDSVPGSPSEDDDNVERFFNEDYNSLAEEIKKAELNAEPIAANIDNEEPSNSINRFLSDSQTILVETDDMEQGGNLKSRMVHNEKQLRPTSFPCVCEKGEKGEQGPKGEPGEPGKIIYIPVFVSNGPTPTPMPPSLNIGGAPGTPVYAGSPQASLNHPTPLQVPQHPNPTVIPFNVPVNAPPVNPSVQNVVPNVPPTSPPQHQQYATPLYQVPMPMPQVQVQQQQQQQQQLVPPAPTTLLYATATDTAQARSSRHSGGSDPRFVNRRV